MNEDAVSVLKTLLPSVILSNPDSTNISSSLSERPPSGPITNNIVSLIDIFDNILLIVFSFSLTLQIYLCLISISFKSFKL